MQTVPVALTVTYAADTMLRDGVAFAADDPRIRLLGGRWVRHPSPWTAYLEAQAATYANNDAPRTILTRDRFSNNPGIEFILPAGEREFELVATEAGSQTDMTVQIDGHATNVRGYQLELRGTSARRHVRVELPPSNRARTVTLGLSTAMFGGLRLPAGETLAVLPDTSNYATVVFEGDSITAGSVATSPLRTWAGLTAVELGFRNPINIAQGSSGYMARRSNGGRPIPERIDDVVRALKDGPPDAIVIGAGINDCVRYTNADVAAAALDYFQALRARAPRMVIIVLGPFNGRNDSYPSSLATCRDAIFASARQVGNIHLVDVADWVNAANRETIFGPTNNGPHPVDAGHAIYATRAAEEIRRIIAGL